MGKRNFGYKTFHPDILIGESDKFQINKPDIKLIEITGHSADSISNIIKNEIAIVGDVMFGFFRNSVFPSFSVNIEKMINIWGIF